MENKKYKFYVHGMHCNSCVIVTESKIKESPNVTYAKSSLKDHSIEIEGNFGDNEKEKIREELSALVKNNGYTLSTEKEVLNKKWDDFKIAIPVALIFITLFVLLQKIGIVNLINISEMSYGASFVIGIIASLSTCMAVVGGLVLSMSATFAKEGDKTKPQILFHIGRLVSFFILGGIIGALGSVFTLNTITTFILGIIIGIVMIVMGTNLLDVFDKTKRAQVSMPKFISKRAFAVSKLNHSLTPLLVGVATFFLPCGFTQSMQIYTLSTGSFINGALTMFIFALGTLPVLAMVSFSSFSIKNSKYSGVFFKTAGIIVIMFALINILNSLVVIGLIKPFLNF
ncbi:TPA: hypothetical protein DIC38_01425 [Candidatus Nomurabacteria bacterium]|nr:MAG: hypothetical protein O210_OD1C00001G0448 [Parcubacteria bacterium RAAC4_OD1_1]HCY26324.1 hypothetical protein [Candidatus Nomurabacteria bacterium]